MFEKSSFLYIILSKRAPPQMETTAEEKDKIV